MVRLSQGGIEMGRLGAKPMVRDLFAPLSFPNNGSNQNCTLPEYSDTSLGLILLCSHNLDHSEQLPMSPLGGTDECPHHPCERPVKNTKFPNTCFQTAHQKAARGAWQLRDRLNQGEGHQKPNKAHCEMMSFATTCQFSLSPCLALRAGNHFLHIFQGHSCIEVVLRDDFAQHIHQQR